MRAVIFAVLLVTSVTAVVVALVAPSGGGGSAGTRAPSARHGGQVDLAARIDDFTTRTIRRSAFRPPTAVERETIADGVGLYLGGHRPEAGRRLAEVDFGVRAFTDTATGRPFAEIADRAPEATRGWGRVYIDLSTTAARWSVQVPHPVADADSEKLGVGAWRRTPGGVLVLAGANRRAGKGDEADVAHRRDTVFHAVCAELIDRRLPGIQLHGYADSTEPDYDVIVSTGRGDHGRAWGELLADELRRQGFEVCRVWVRRCTLEGRTNVQGRDAASSELPFLHVEFSRTVRASPARIAEAVTAIHAASGGITARPSRPSPAAGLR